MCRYIYIYIYTYIYIYIYYHYYTTIVSTTWWLNHVLTVSLQVCLPTSISGRCCFHCQQKRSHAHGLMIFRTNKSTVTVLLACFNEVQETKHYSQQSEIAHDGPWWPIWGWFHTWIEHLSGRNLTIVMSHYNAFALKRFAASIQYYVTWSLSLSWLWLLLLLVLLLWLCATQEIGKAKEKQ